jgi:hypothetical protein
LSDIEWRLFLHLDWCDEVSDIREQFPLDRAITRRIAEELGIRHPTNRTTKTPLVMTTNFLVDLTRDRKMLQEAAMSNQLQSCRKTVCLKSWRSNAASGPSRIFLCALLQSMNFLQY